MNKCIGGWSAILNMRRVILPPKRNNIFIKCTATFLIILLFSACTGCSSRKNILLPPLTVPRTDVIKTVAPERKTLVKEVIIHGIFIPTMQQELRFNNNGGYLKAGYVKLGDHVEKGKLLAELDAATMANAVACTELEYKIMELDYEKFKTLPDADTFELKKMELSLESKQLELEHVKKLLTSCKIYAPFSGEVVYLDESSIGDFLSLKFFHLVRRTHVKIANRCN